MNKQLSQSHDEGLDENGNFDLVSSETDRYMLSPPPQSAGFLANSRSFSNFKSVSGGMTSRPSFISLMLIASDDELSRLPKLPAPLQVETDTYQKCGWEDEPKNCSHLPVLHPPSDSEDESEAHNGILQTIIHLPERMRKISADKQRFNVYALPDQDRKQLKNLYVF